jgi:hypothetical protein
MGLFGWLQTRPQPAPDGLAAVLDRLERVENALAKHARAASDLQLEWESVLDKIARYTARQAARTRREIEQHVAPPGQAPVPAEPAPSTPSGLTDKAELRRLYMAGAIRKLGG